MENELEKNIPVPAPEVEKDKVPISQPDVDVEKKNSRGTRNRGKGKRKEEPKEDDNVIHMDTDASGEYVFKVSGGDEAVSEDLEGEIANKEIIIANLKRQKELILKNAFPGTEEDDAEDIKRIDDQLIEEEEVLNRLKNSAFSNENSITKDNSSSEPLPDQPPLPPAQSELNAAPESVDVSEKKVELTDEERKSVKEIFQQEDFKNAYASVLTDFEETFQKIYSPELLENDDERKKELDLLRSRFDSNDQLIQLLPNASVADYIFSFLMDEYRVKFQEKNLDQDSKASAVTPFGELASSTENVQDFVITRDNYEDTFHSNTQFREQFANVIRAAYYGVKAGRNLANTSTDFERIKEQNSRLRSFIIGELRKNGSLSKTPPAVLESLCDLFINEAVQRLNEQEPLFEAQPLEPVLQPEVIRPVDEIPHRDLRSDLNPDGTQKAVVATVPVRQDESSASVVLENSAGAPLVESFDATPDISVVLENKASGEAPQSSPETKQEVAPKSPVQIAQKEIEDTLELKDGLKFGGVRSAFVEADGWLGKNGFTSRDIAAIEKNYQEASTDYASSVTKTSGGSGVRVNLLKPAPQLSDVINDYVASLSTSGAAFVDIRHAKKFFASDDQKNALAQGLKKYFKTRKEYEDGKKQVARGMWEKMGGVELQKTISETREELVSDSHTEQATVAERAKISALRSSIFEEAIVCEMERFNKEKIDNAGESKKGMLEKALGVVRNINPKLRLAFTTAVATGVVAVGVSTAGIGTLGVLGAYAGSRFIRGLVASGVGVSAGQLTNYSLGRVSEFIHNRKLSQFQERLLSVEGEADFDQFIDTYTRERSDIFKDYLLAKKIVLTATVVTGIAAGAIANAEIGEFTNTTGFNPNPLKPSSVDMAPPDPKLPPATPDAVGAKPTVPETTPTVPKTSELVETGKNIPKAEHIFKGPVVSPELEKIAGGAKSLQEMFKGEGVKLNLDELKNAAVVGKGGSAWSVVHKQLELLAKSGIEPQKLGLNISVDDVKDHAKFSHALEMRTRSILEENGFISKTGEVRIASPDTRLDLTATVDGKGNTHFVINKPVATDRPVFYEYHPTQRLSVPVNHIPPEIPSNHIPESRINIDTVPHADDMYPHPVEISGEQVAPSGQKIILDNNLPNSPVKQSDINEVLNPREDVVPEPRPAGLEQTPPPLPKVDHLISEKTLTNVLPIKVTPNEVLKLRDFLENMGFSDAYIETRWQDLSRISVGEFQKHIDEILKHKADPKLFSRAIHFDKDLASKTFLYNPGADIPAEDRLYKIADLINDKKEVIERNDLLQKRSVAEFILNEAIYPLLKK